MSGTGIQEAGVRRRLLKDRTIVYVHQLAQPPAAAYSAPVAIIPQASLFAIHPFTHCR